VGVVIVSACGGSTEPDPDPGPTGPLAVIARPQVSDTVTASPIQGIVVQVRDAAGLPIAFTTVQFRGLPSLGNSVQLSMLVRAAGTAIYSAFVAVTTDTRGRALAQVQFGTIAGAGQVEIAVPEFGLADTVSFTIGPGNLARITATPRDTAMHPGGAVSLQAFVGDRFGNPRSDPVLRGRSGIQWRSDIQRPRRQWTPCASARPDQLQSRAGVVPGGDRGGPGPGRRCEPDRL